MSKSKVLAVADEASVGFKDRTQRSDVGVDLLVDGGELGGFEDDFERNRAGFRRRAENAVVTLMDDAVGGTEAVDDGVVVAGQVGFGGAEGGGEDVAGQGSTADKAIDALTGVVTVQGNDAIEAEAAELVLKDADFRVVGIFPELPVEIGTPAVETGAVFVAGGIANRVEEQLISAGEFGFLIKECQESEGGVAAGGFVTMEAGENAKAEVGGPGAWADEEEAGQGVGETTAEIHGFQGCVKDAIGTLRLLPGGGDKGGDGAAFLHATLGLGGDAHGNRKPDIMPTAKNFESISI
jgi:hypothetical protein